MKLNRFIDIGLQQRMPSPIYRAEIMERMDTLLASFVVQARMKLVGEAYEPCYRIIKQVFYVARKM